MIYGQTFQYADVSGTLVPPPWSASTEDRTLWLLTQDKMLIGVPADSPKLKPIEALPITKEDVKITDKLYLNAGFISLSARPNIPAGRYKIVSGGLGIERNELVNALRSIEYESDTHKLSIVTWDKGKGYFIIETPLGSSS